MKKNTTSNFEKANKWIASALKTGENAYFRFVDFTYKCIYGEWITPENAMREIKNRNERNTLRIERVIF